MGRDRLVDSLVDDLEPVRPLAAPSVRVLRWLAIALPVIAAVVFAMGPRPDLPAKVTDWIFATQELAMVTTAVTAGWAALAAGIPGTSRRALCAPLVPLCLWLASMAYQYAREWSVHGLAGPSFGLDLECVPAIAATGSVPLAAMVAMIRRGTTFNRGLAAFWGTLASAALANAGLRLFHPVDAALMVIVWQFGTVAAFTLAATLAKDVLVPTRRHAWDVR